jgi:hypothetical protein
VVDVGDDGDVANGLLLGLRHDGRGPGRAENGAE